MTQRRTLAFYLPNLAGGGVERVLLMLAPHFIKAGYDVTFLLHKHEGELANSVPEGVRVVSFNCTRTITALPHLMRYIWREKPSLIYSSLGHNNIISLLAARLAGGKVPVIISQHNALSAETVAGHGLRFSKTLPRLYNLCWRLAGGIVAVSQGVADDMTRIANIPSDRIDVIYNPVVTPDFAERAAQPPDHPWFDEGQPPVILAVGRFVEQKNFISLVAAFALLAPSVNARLVFLGNGPLRGIVKERAEALGLLERVAFVDYRTNPLPLIQRAKLLVLSSRHEGFGNVLVEALACGTPVVSTDCPFGPAEILDGGKYGRLVPVDDAAALAEAMITTLNEQPYKAALRARASDFKLDKIGDSYLSLFERVCTERPRLLPLPEISFIPFPAPVKQGARTVNVNFFSDTTILAYIRNKVKHHKGFALATINLDHVVNLVSNKEFMRAYHAHDAVVADGFPIVWIGKLSHRAIVRTTGSDMTLPMIELLHQTGAGLAIVGTTQEVLNKVSAILLERYPGLNIVYLKSPSFGFSPTGVEAVDILKQVHASKAALCLLAVGSPKQEIMAALGKDIAPQTGFVSVGAAIDFIAGHQKRAPRWMRKSNLEWLWRLSLSPRRLFKRYALCALIFPILLLRHRRED